ncbi:MAG: hypothetical protein H0W33_03750 [Gammaproteobacteria bacterium]|nr:hypothetical protein [Gammaproteobacteria bacterium]
MKSDKRSAAWIVAGVGLLTTGLCLAEGSVGKQEWASPGKPSAPIEMSYSLHDQPVAGAPLRIELAVTARMAADLLTLELNFPDSGLTLVSALGAQRMADPVAGERYMREVRVLPREDGQFHLNVVATLLRDGVPQARAFSIPIRVGDAIPSAPEARGILKSDDTGRALLSMPAIESGTGL